MNHQAGGDAGTVNRAAGGAGSRLRFGLWEQGRGIVLSGVGVDGGEDPHRLAEHAAVRPEFTLLFQTAPDGAASTDAVDTAKHDLSCWERGAVAVDNWFHLNGRIDSPEESSGGEDFGLPEILGEITLRGDVRWFDNIKIHKLQVTDSDGSELDGDLSADRADSDDSDGHFVEFVSRDKIPLAFEAVGGVHVGTFC